MDKELKSFLIATLRRASYRWSGRYNALKESRIGRNEYVCASCGLIHGRKEGHMDHIEPAVDPVKGWVNLEEFAIRLFCDKSGFARLCISCHKDKTNQEREIRKENKSKKVKK